MSQRIDARERAEIRQDIEDLAAITDALRRRALMRGVDYRLLVYFYEMVEMELARQIAKFDQAD